MLLLYAVAGAIAPWSPKRGAGLVFGVAAALVFVFEMAYPLRRARAGRQRALEPFRRMITFVDPEEKEIVNDLMTIRMEKMDLDVHYSLQGVLRRWLIVHVPPAALLMALLVLHILAWAVY